MATQKPQAKTAVRATAAKPVKPAAAVKAPVKAAAKPAVKPVVKTAIKPAVKPVAKPAAKAAAPVKPAVPAKAKSVAKPVAKAPAKAIAPALKKAVAPVAKAIAKPLVKTEKKAELKLKKIKQVRDSFTMPETEYEVLSQVKKSCLKAGFEIKKSDLLRIGVSLIKNLETGKLKTLLAGLTPLKVGRPKK